MGGEEQDPPSTGAEHEKEGLLGGDSGSSHSCSAHKDVERKNLITVLLLTVAFVVAEFILAAAANSLSLVADALHHLLDGVIIVTALLAIELGQRNPENNLAQIYRDPDGNAHYLIELIVAIGNSILLLSLSAGVIIDALLRMEHHEHMENVDALLIILVGTVSVIVNIIKVYYLHASAMSSLNIRTVYIHAIADVAGSVVLVAGGITLKISGDNEWDRIAAVVIASLVILNVGWALVPSVKLLTKGSETQTAKGNSERTVDGTDTGTAVEDESVGSSVEPARPTATE